MNGNTMKVLVLLAAFNGRRWITEQIDSIMSQKDVCVSLVVRDDCSSDGTYEALVSTYGAKNERISVLRGSAPSGSAGNNFRRLIELADVADWDFVAFADQDDVWMADKLFRAIACMNQANADAYSSAVISFWESSGKKSLISPSNGVSRLDFLFESAGQGCTYVMSKQLFARVQDFVLQNPEQANKMVFHDWMVYALARSWGLNWMFDKTPSVIYRQHGGNEIGARGNLQGVLRRVALIRNGWFADQIVAAGDVVEATGRQSNEGRRLIDMIRRRQERSVVECLLLGCAVLRVGRRRFSDRALLALSASLRWI